MKVVKLTLWFFWSLSPSSRLPKLSAITPQSVDQLLQNIIQDPRLFNDWIARRVSQYNSARLKFYCSMAALNRNRFVECANLADKLTGFI